MVGACATPARRGILSFVNSAILRVLRNYLELDAHAAADRDAARVRERLRRLRRSHAAGPERTHCAAGWARFTQAERTSSNRRHRVKSLDVV
jgi:hypothetical protein